MTPTCRSLGRYIDGSTCLSAGAVGGTAPVVEIAVTGPYFYTTGPSNPKLGAASERPQRGGVSAVSFVAMGLGPADFFSKAHVAPLVAVVLVAAAAWYLWSVRRLAARGRAWSASRTACFAGAWLLVAVAAFSGLHAFDSTNFSSFGSQYVMAGLVAPALLALSTPLSLAAQSSSRPGPARWLESRPMRVVTHPLVTWIPLGATVFVVFFTKGLLRPSLAGGLVQQAVLLWVLAVGWLFFLPVVDVEPIPYRLGPWGRILYLLLTIPVFTIVGMGVESQSHSVTATLSVRSLQLGGAVVWVAANGVAICGALAVFVQWLRADETRAKHHDTVSEAAAARQLAIWRASRDAAARASR